MQRYRPEEIEVVYRVITERRDMRHFLPGPIEPAALARLLEAAHQAPSVGLMQPWRFVRVTDPELRRKIHARVAEERDRTATALGSRGEEFRRRKVEGILSCGELLVAALADGREAHVFGRRTLPEMDLCSVACAIPLARRPRRRDRYGLGVDVRSRGRGGDAEYAARQ
jgi:5,6-dimethylbenzimidazole synthase